jgi:hypothetical protein
MSTCAGRVRDISDYGIWVRSERMFYLDPGENPVDGWYFKVRGPRFFGPFPSRREANLTLRRIVNDYLDRNETGGR